MLTAAVRDNFHDGYAQIVREAKGYDDLEALVLLHEDVMLRDSDLSTKLQIAFTDPTVAILGVIGGRRPQSLWWAGEVPSFGVIEESRCRVRWLPAPADVDVVDGCFFALPRWAMDHLEVDTRSYPVGDACAADLSLQARTADMQVVVSTIDVFHAAPPPHRSALAVRADRAWRRKWRGSPFLDSRTRRWDTYPVIFGVADATTRKSGYADSRRWLR